MDTDLPADREDDAGAVQRRRLPAPERRATIMEAALRGFAARGYEGAPMDEIAAEAGVSKAVVYDHFSSKRELYTVLMESIRDDLDAVIDAAQTLGGAPGEPSVRLAMQAFFQYVEEHREACRLLLLELQGTSASPLGLRLEDRVASGIAATLGADPSLLAAHPERDRQLVVLAELLKSAVLGLASWWYRHPEVPRDVVIERTVALVWPAIERARA